MLCVAQCAVKTVFTNHQVIKQLTFFAEFKSTNLHVIISQILNFLLAKIILVSIFKLNFIFLDDDN